MGEHGPGTAPTRFRLHGLVEDELAVLDLVDAVVAEIRVAVLDEVFRLSAAAHRTTVTGGLRSGSHGQSGAGCGGAAGGEPATAASNSAYASGDRW